MTSPHPEPSPLPESEYKNQECACFIDIERLQSVNAAHLTLIEEFTEALERMEDQGSKCNTCNCWEIAKEALARSRQVMEGKK